MNVSNKSMICRVDLSQHPVHNVDECEALMEKGWRNRAVGSTLMNADSSRSHSIFTISIEMMAADQHIRKGKLNLVDLAGSERQAKTGAIVKTKNSMHDINSRQRKKMNDLLHINF